jgi:uncharacterized membrane protein
MKKKDLLILLLIIIAIILFYLLYPKYYFVSPNPAVVLRCNKITGKCEVANPGY